MDRVKTALAIMNGSKMQTTYLLVVFGILLQQTFAGTFPDSIKKCKVSDPKFDDCVLSSANALMPAVIEAKCPQIKVTSRYETVGTSPTIVNKEFGDVNMKFDDDNPHESYFVKIPELMKSDIEQLDTEPVKALNKIFDLLPFDELFLP
ncbi:hypothetical protein CBL_08266 [Carabus blaptoides fortunei]